MELEKHILTGQYSETFDEDYLEVKYKKICQDLLMELP